MRVGIQGWGSEGDLRPLVALGARLREAGHEVRLVLSPIDGLDWAPLCRALGLALKVVPEAMPDTLPEICRAAQAPDPSKVSRRLMDLAYLPFEDAMFAAAVELCAGSDLVVGLFSSSYVKAACLKTGTPFVSLHYYPGMIPSRERPPIGFPAWRWTNRASWRLFGAVLDLAFLKPSRRFFARHGLPAPRHAIPDVLLSERLDLAACSPSLFAPPSDWGERHVVCGDFVLPADAQPWSPAPELQAFLDEGEKPVLVSFGTLEHLAPERARALVLGAVREAGVRALVQTKVGEGGEGRDGDVYFLRWADHRHLLPRCRAMVLHGGAGTTHAALRGGVPAVVVPFIFEQGLWGGLLHRAGSATRPLSFWKATSASLGARIREAVGSEPMRRRAAELAARVAGEDGVGEAVRRLERLAAQGVQSMVSTGASSGRVGS